MDVDACSIPELVCWSTETYADLVAIRDGEVSLTYAELGARIDQAARAMVVGGIEPGDTVAVWAPNCWQWVVAGLAVSRAGAVLVPINTRFKGREAAYVMRTAGVRLLFVVDGFLDTDYSGSLAGHELATLNAIVDLAASSSNGVTGFEEFLAGGGPAAVEVAGDARAVGAVPAAGANVAELQAEVERRSAAVGPADIGLIMFTSGTTGNPKGVMVRGGAIIRAFHAYGRALTVHPGDPYLLINPYFHAFGYNSGIIVCLLFGAINLPVAVYEPEAVMATIERERVAVFPGPPALFQGLLNHPRLDDHDLSSLRSCVTGAASIPVEMIVAMRERLGFEIVISAYGMTETSGIAAYTMADDPPEVAATTSGKAIPGAELRVVDDDGVDVAPGTEGELLVRGYQVTPGYLDDPVQTAEAIDEDGWLHTGDIAVMNTEGYIDITDRKKDMFIVGGFNAYPAEIERTLVEHPLVGIASVIGVPDERLGEVGAAFIVPSPAGAPAAEELVAWSREQMANYKVPRHIWIVEQLPLNASNKVLKQELRVMASELLGASG